MTFSINVPVNSQSPGLFPAQNNNNFSRLKTLIGADHNFLDTAGVGQGFHNQVNLINRSAPTGALPAGSGGTLYANTNNLKFYNGTTSYGIAPTDGYLPVKQFGSAFLAPQQVFDIPDVINGTLIIPYNYAGTGYAFIDDSVNTVFNFYSIYHVNGTLNIQQITRLQAGGNPRPDLVNNGAAHLAIKNNQPAVGGVFKLCYWCLTINRFS